MHVMGGFFDDLVTQVSKDAQAAAQQTASNALTNIANQISSDPKVQEFARQQAEQQALQTAVLQARTAGNWISDNKWLLIGGGVGIVALLFLLTRKK